MSRPREGAVAMTISAQVRKMYPDCYFCPGVGWCGPEWREAEALEAKLRAASGAECEVLGW